MNALLIIIYRYGSAIHTGNLFMISLFVELLPVACSHMIIGKTRGWNIDTVMS
jgi:hypothetical protein